MNKGLIHIYCGDGKGKTTAAIGLAVRAAGCGMNVLIVQFLKGQDTSELHSLDKLPSVKVLRGTPDLGFTLNMTSSQKTACKETHDKNLSQAISLCSEGKVDLLVLDELIAAYNLHLVDRDAVLCFLKSKPSSLEVAITGRDPAVELCDLADYISEIKNIKHPYEKGIAARKGIEK